MSRVLGLFGGRNRYEGNAAVLTQIAREVVEKRRSIQGGLNEVRHPAVLDALADEDFRHLDELIAASVDDHREYAVVLARLAHAAARAKGFDRQIVDAAIRLDSLLPLDDSSRERDQLLRDAYMVAHKAGYARGGRITLARLGQRSLENDDIERARRMFQQQLEIGEEATDGPSEVDSAIALGDILRRDGDSIGAQALYRRAGRSAQRLDDHHGLAEAMVRQIELVDPGTPLESIAAMQRQALDAAERTPDHSLQAKILIQLAESLTRLKKVDEVEPYLERGVEIAREIGDLSLESRCLHALMEASARLGRTGAVADALEDLLDLEERLGNRPAAGSLAVQLGVTYLDLRRPDLAVETFERSRTIAASLRDAELEQKALGGLGAAYTELNEPSKALDRLERAFDVARREHDVRREAQWLASIGQTLWRFRQIGEAGKTLNEALALARRMDDSALQAELLATLGDVHLAEGQAPRARESYSRAYELQKRLDNVPEQVRLLTSLGRLALETRQTSQAHGLFEQALRLAEDSGNRLAAARLHGRLGKLAQSQRDAAGALDHFRRAAHLAESAGNEELIAQSVLSLAAAQHAVNDPGTAASYARALQLARSLEQPDREALINYNLGLLFQGQGRDDQALHHLYRAADIVVEFDLNDAALSDRIEEAIDALGGTTLQTPPSRAHAGLESDERSLDWGQEDGWAERPITDDELYDETTLHPQ